MPADRSAGAPEGRPPCCAAAVAAVEAKLALSRQKLRDLSAHNEYRLEQERRSIAREIHDELGQLLTALKMECSLLRRQYPDDPLLQKKIETMRSLLDNTIGVVRHVVSNLRPPALDHGIIPAIEWLAEDFSLRWEMPCRLELDADDILLDDTRATALFRIIQESLTNVARHAAASEVVISLGRQESLLRLTILDNGCGFDPAVVAKKPGFGLQGMRERALAFDGTMRVASAPGAGTAVTVVIPL
ncbi:MAG TPA: sensor histidine kinase [Rhodocyclaceae bacterium]|nr:sensor histidine kinase [Rhodocyclaceae bacterium]